MSFASSVANKVSRRLGFNFSRSANLLIFRALVSLASGVLLVRAMGFVNQIAITSRFGAGAEMDAYFVASGLPLLVASFLIGAIEASIIPVFARVRERRSPEHSTAIFSTLVNLFLIGATLLTLVIIVFRRQLLFLTAPALDPSRMEMAVQLAPIIFPVLLLMLMAGLLECVLNTEGQFGWPAYAAALVPLATAVIVIIAGARFGVAAIAVGALVGVGLQLGVLIYRLRLAHISYRPVLDLRLPEIGLVFVAAAPALLGAMVNQASPLVDQIFASYLSPGSIAALSYAEKISGLPVGLVFVTVGRAALPYLARQAADRDMGSFKATLRLYLWLVGLGTAALSALMLVLAHPLVQLLFQRGAFTPEDTSHTAITMMGFAVGLAPMGMGFLLARAFSALGKNHLLMYVTIFSVIANAIFDYVMGRLWQSFGIALATSAVYFCTLIILLIMLRRSIGALDLLTPPVEVIRVAKGISTGKYYRAARMWKEENIPPLHLAERLRMPLMYAGAAALALIIGAAVPRIDAQLALRIVVGLPIILLLLRYRYALLIAWMVVGVLVGSSLSMFSGKNIDTGLTISTILLLVTISIPETLRRMPALAIIGLYLVWVLAGIANSPLGTTDFLKSWLLEVAFVAVAALAITLITTRRRLLLVVDAMLGVSACIALYGIADYLQHRGISDYRILSIFAAAPPFALFLTLVIPLAFYRILIAQGTLVRLAALGVLFILLAALALTFSRGALITLPLSLGIMAFFLPSKRLRRGLVGGALGLAALGVIVATVGNIPLFARFSNLDVSSLNGRTYLWQALLDHFDPMKFQGAGLGSATELLTKLSLGTNGVSGAGLIATAPSNLYIGTLYDTGIIGLALLVAALAALGIGLIMGIRRTTGEHRLLFTMALLVLINMLIQSVEQDDLWSQGVAQYFWIAMALPFAAYWFKPSQTNELAQTPTRRIPTSHAQSILAARPATAYRRQSSPRERRGSARVKKPRIYLVIATFYPQVGGAERQALLQCRALRAQGYDTTVITLRHERAWPRREVIDGAPVERVSGAILGNRQRLSAPLRKLAYIVGVFALSWTLWRQRRNYDLVHLYRLNELILPVAFVCLATGKPLIVGLRCANSPQETVAPNAAQQAAPDEWRNRSRGDLESLAQLGAPVIRLTRFLLQRTRAVMVVLSSRMRSDLDASDFPTAGARVIPNGVDIQQFFPVAHDALPAGHDRVALYAGRLVYQKGVDALLRAWRRVQEGMPTGQQTRLVIAGAGPSQASLERLARTLGITDCVEFVGLQRDILTWLHRSDLVVLPSRWEGMPNAVLEAMACGLPCVATRVSGSEDIIQDGVNGLLVEPDDDEALASALLSLLRDLELCQQYGHAARATVEERYSLDYVTGLYLELYQKVWRDHTQPAPHRRDD